MVVTLFRCRTPTDWLCPCGKVARALRRHGHEYDEIRVPFRQAHGRDDVIAMTRQRHVPVAIVDGDAICDSKRIVEHLEWRAAGAGPAAGSA